MYIPISEGPNFGNYLNALSKVWKLSMEIIFFLWNKHVYLQKVNQEYFIWNNYSLITTETIIIQTDETTIQPIYAIQANKLKFYYK